MSVTRRTFLNTAPLAALPIFGNPTGAAPHQLTVAVDPGFPTQPADLAREMVTVCHGNIARVKELLDQHPTLSRASWDWGFGDWEDALGAASHVGNRDIATLLLEKGARPTLFSATMLGQIDVVKAFIAASPGIESTPGPHGITLMAHATAGGPQSQTVADYLQTLPGAGARPQTQPITPERLKALTGDFVFGAGETERVAIALTANGTLTFTRSGRAARSLTHIGDMTFYPSGAPLVRVRFANASGDMIMTVHDPTLVITATRR